jgi:hypothetical protein
MEDLWFCHPRIPGIAEIDIAVHQQMQPIHAIPPASSISVLFSGKDSIRREHWVRRDKALQLLINHIHLADTNLIGIAFSFLESK